VSLKIAVEHGLVATAYEHNGYLQLHQFACLFFPVCGPVRLSAGDDGRCRARTVGSGSENLIKHALPHLTARDRGSSGLGQWMTSAGGSDVGGETTAMKAASGGCAAAVVASAITSQWR
jgi:hypothetical protein